MHKDRPYHDGTFTDWSAVRSPQHPNHYFDGVAIYVTTVDVNPDDEFTTREDARPAQPSESASPDSASERENE